MTLSDLSVRRPVFAAVAAIILVVVGIASFTRLSVRELPSVDPAQVSVGTTYIGASAEVVEERITQVIERQIAGIQGIDRVNSVSRDGRSQINIAFKPDRKLEEAANDVRDAVNRVSGRLPLGVDPPQINKANSDNTPIMLINLSSKTMNRMELTDYANRYLVERMSTIQGVSQIGVGGAQNYAMRVWLDPDAMAARGITVDDVRSALTSQNVELPAGTLESSAKDFTIRVARQYSRPEDFAQLPLVNPTSVSGAGAVANTGGAGATAVANPTIRASGGYITRLGDVARIEEAPDERRRMNRALGQDTIGFQVMRQSDANDLDIAKETRKMVAEINETLPEGMEMVIAVDFSIFTEEAIKEVWITMAISLALVAIVNIMFLGSWRSAVIPTIVAPICILSTFIVLAALGFSINLLTLLALVLAIGLVVDDAIVVVENIQRRLDEGEPPLVAAERGARQVYFAIIAVTAVLMTVFAPLMFMPGYTGKLFVELAVAVAAAIGFSALLALTLSPMLASKLLRPVHNAGWLARQVDRFVDALRRSYAASLHALLGKKRAAGAAFALLLILAGGAWGLFVTLPKETVPSEDRGMLQVNINGPEGAGYDYMTQVALQVEPHLAKLRAEGIVDRYVIVSPGFGGGSSFNSASSNITLVPWGKRTITADEVATRLNRELSDITGARINVSTPAALGGRGGPGGGGANSVQMIARGDDYDALNTWIQPVFAAARENPNMGRARLDYDPSSPRLLVNLDREKAAALGIPPRAVGTVLETMLGSTRVGTYIKAGQEYDVILQTELDQRRTVEDLAKLYVRSSQGALVPLSAVTTTELRGDTPDRRRVDRQRSVSLNVELNDGYTMDQGIRFLKEEVKKLPPEAVISWGSAAKEYLEQQGGAGFAFGMALLLVFLVLAAQFESWIHPAVIISTVPLAALGGLFALLMAGSSLNLYSQIGLIILIGIAAKNGILIVEFANQLRDEGREIKEAIIESCEVRLRPIIMTSIAAAMGALPLIFAHGPGANSRETIGVVIFAGCLFSTLLTLFIVPVFYNLLARYTKSPEWTAKQIESYEEQERLEGPRGALPMPAE